MPTQNPQGAMQGPDAVFNISQGLSSSISFNRAAGYQGLSGGQVPMALLGDSLVERFWANTIGISSITFSNGIATVNTATAHNMWPTLNMALRGSTQIFLNGQFSVLTVPTTTSFTVFIGNTQAGLTASGIATGASYMLSSNFLTANNSIFSYVQMKTNFKFNIVSNAGVSGERTDQVILRLSEVTTSGALHCYVLVGINDCTQNIPASTIIGNLNLIYQTLLAAGITVHARTLIGYGSAAGVTTAQISAMNTVNAWIRRQSNNPGIYVVDYHSFMQDPASATGLNLAANMDASNTVHPSPTGSIGCAALDATSFNAIFPVQPNTLPTNQADSVAVSGINGQGFSNPTFQGAGLATNWSSSIGGVTTVDTTVARTTGTDGDTCGNNQSRAYTNATAAAQSANLFQQPANNRFSPGDLLVMQAECSWTGLTAAIDSVRLILNMTIDGILYTATSGIEKNTQVLTTDNLKARMMTPPLRVPAGNLTVVQAFIGTRFNNNATPTLLVGRAALRNIA